MTTVHNLTVNDITLMDTRGNMTTIHPSGTVARIKVVSYDVDWFAAGLPIQVNGRGIVGLPVLSDPLSRIYLVDEDVLLALSGTGREDVFSPARGPTDGVVRDDWGGIVAFTKLNGVAP